MSGHIGGSSHRRGSGRGPRAAGKTLDIPLKTFLGNLSGCGAELPTAIRHL